MFCRQPSALLAFRCFGALCGCLWLLRRWFREVSRDEPLVYLRTLVLCGVRLCRLSCNVYKKKMADNQSAIKLLRNPVSSARSKHIDVVHHFARERVQLREVAFQYVSTYKMLADVFTKVLPGSKHNLLCQGMGMG